jgi:tRNA modification GTPase
MHDPHFQHRLPVLPHPAHGTDLMPCPIKMAGESPEIIAIDMREALHHLGLIIGRSVSDDILERIFEQFCIGK